MERENPCLCRSEDMPFRGNKGGYVLAKIAMDAYIGRHLDRYLVNTLDVSLKSRKSCPSPAFGPNKVPDYLD